MKRLIAFFSFLILAAAAVTAGCGGGKDDKSAYKAVLKEELVVCTEAAFAPFEYEDKKTGELRGFDIDLIRAVAKEMGFKKCTVTNMNFDDLIPAINARKADVSIAGLSITEERKKMVFFSKPYYKSGLAFIVRKGVDDVRSFEDLKTKRVAVQEKTTGALYGEKLQEKGAVLKMYETTDQALMELMAGNVDAIICDLPVLQHFLAVGGSSYARLAGDPLTEENYGIMVSKKNPDMVKAVDQALDALKQNGTYDKLYDKWFGSGKAK